MNNQNGISEQNEVVTPVGVENNSFQSSDAVTTPHDLSKIQELVNQLESKIQKINSGDIEEKPSFNMERVYQNSVQNGTMNQTVSGEMYVGKNPTLAKFVEETRKAILPALKNQLGMGEVSFSDSKNQSIPSLELTTPISFGEPKEVSPAPVGISSPPLKPESIFDEDEVIGEESVSQQAESTYPERSKVA